MSENGFGEDNRIPLLKAHFLSNQNINDSNVLQANDDHEDQNFQEVGALTPPYDAKQLTTIFEHSNSLRQNIDSYAVNIDGFGHRFEPVINLDADSAEEDVKIAMMLSSEDEMIAELMESEEGYDPEVELDIPEPSDADVEKRIEDIRSQMGMEKARLKAWFDFASDDCSFLELRRRTRLDLEITGNAYWEVLRNEDGQPAQINYIPSFTMRLLPKDRDLTEYEAKYRTASLEVNSVVKKKCFRKFVQVHNAQRVFYKEYGDPRLISSRTGKAYKDLKSMEKAEDYETTDGTKVSSTKPATEIIHFKVFSSRSSYGVPRWIGSLLSVMGSRQAEEVNFLYFENKSVPPLAIMVSGGRLADESAKRLEDYIKNELHGRRNFHKILVLEAEGPSSGQMFENSGRMRIEIKPLTDAANKDALFMGYDERNMDKVGMTFRLPRLLRGDIRDFNRASAEAALEFTEGQVFSPERSEFDHMINRFIMPDLDCKWWKFRSNGPSRMNPRDLVDMISELKDIFPPSVLHELAEEAFGRDFADIEEEWVKRPISLAVGGITPAIGEGQDLDPEGASEGQEELEDEEAEKSLQPAQDKKFRRLPPSNLRKKAALSQVRALLEVRKELEENANNADVDKMLAAIDKLQNSIEV
jgi:PBSX family phage portal protein